MNKFLSISNKSYQEEYKEKNYIYTRKLFIFLFTNMFFSNIFIFFTIYIVGQKQKKEIISMKILLKDLLIGCGFDLIIVFYFYFSKKINKLFNFMNLIIIFVLNIVCVFFINYYFDKKKFYTMFLLGFCYQITINLIAKFTTWYYTIVKDIVFLVFFGVLYLNLNVLEIIAFVTTFGCLIVEKYSFYSNEYFRKNQFLMEKYNNDNAETMKNLLYQLYPGAVFVLNCEDNSKIIEMNKNNEEFDENFIEKVFKIDAINQEAKDKFQIEKVDKFIRFMKSLTIKNYQFTNSNETIEIENINMLDLFKKSINYSSKSKEKTFKISFTGIYKNLEGNEINLQGFLVFYYWNSNIPNFVFLIEDIELKFEIERLKELDKFKDQTLACVTHDLRTPINGMQFFLNEAKENLDNKEMIRNYIDWSLNNSELLLGLINDILDYSQLKNNKMNLNIERFYLKDIIKECGNLLKIKADFKQIELIFTNKLNENITIRNDKKRIKQILINLITNAIKFTSNGFVKVIFEKDNENLITTTVEDSGIGMSEKVIESLCKPYSTFDNRGVNKEGIGLGLFICKKVAGFVGPYEKLTIKSIVDQGSTFSYNFFINNSDEFICTSIEELNQNEEIYIKNINLKENPFKIHSEQNSMICLLNNDNINEKKGLNILIVDDDFFSLMALKTNFYKIKKNKNYNINKIFEANGGEKCLEIFKENNIFLTNDNIDVVVLDEIMPIITGHDVADKIKRICEEEDYVRPVIVGNSALNSDMMYRNFDYILNKPSTIENIEDLLDKIN